MSTHCTSNSVEFQPFFSRKVTARFDGGRLTCDASALLLREVEHKINFFERLAECFTDYRNEAKIEHTTEQLLRQRIVGIALGDDDLDDHERWRLDSLLPLLCGQSDLSSEKRKRSRDQGVALGGASTLNRMELGKPDRVPSDRHRKIVADSTRMDRLLVDLLMESYDSAPEEIWWGCRETPVCKKKLQRRCQSPRVEAVNSMSPADGMCNFRIRHASHGPNPVR